LGVGVAILEYRGRYLFGMFVVVAAYAPDIASWDRHRGFKMNITYCKLLVRHSRPLATGNY
jgi:hypothetical protein